MSFLFPKSPDIPPPAAMPQPPAPEADKSVQEANQRQRMAAALAAGRESTILGGSLVKPAKGGRTLLGQA